MSKDNNYDWLVKLLIIGDSGVGKTNVLLRACEDKFVPSHLMTIGTIIDLNLLSLSLKIFKRAFLWK